MHGHLTLFLSRFGYVGIFLALAFGVIGLPIPDELLLTYVGYNVAQGTMKLSWAILSALSGSITGISISYIIGSKLGYPVIKRFAMKLRINIDHIEKTRKMFVKYGSILLIVGYFIPGVRHFIAIAAGLSHMSYKKFALFSYTGALLWTSVFIMTGNGLGAKWYIVIRYFHLYKAFLPPIISLLLILTLLFLYFRKSND
ncbi:DedA family protein [Paenibacillus sp. UNC451MF]|uniref:DedA family protein n=1 Tax=Paenibacillus sp. UNC451MF TaxID=1449063 RepID=UPI00048EEB22|nr:DedA family protein [Paenibacillus sp. UNC451MF]